MAGFGEPFIRIRTDDFSAIRLVSLVFFDI
jgi:hypothetical protein